MLPKKHFFSSLLITVSSSILMADGSLKQDTSEEAQVKGPHSLGSKEDTTLDVLKNRYKQLLDESAKEWQQEWEKNIDGPYYINGKEVNSFDFLLHLRAQAQEKVRIEQEQIKEKMNEIKRPQIKKMEEMRRKELEKYKEMKRIREEKKELELKTPQQAKVEPKEIKDDVKPAKSSLGSFLSAKITYLFGIIKKVFKPLIWR